MKAKCGKKFRRRLLKNAENDFSPHITMRKQEQMSGSRAQAQDPAIC